MTVLQERPGYTEIMDIQLSIFPTGTLTPSLGKQKHEKYGEEIHGETPIASLGKFTAPLFARKRKMEN